MELYNLFTLLYSFHWMNYLVTFYWLFLFLISEVLIDIDNHNEGGIVIKSTHFQFYKTH